MLLMTLPNDYDTDVFNEYVRLMPVAIDLGKGIDNSAITVWVCNPDNQLLIDGQKLDQYPNLKVLATASTGTNHIDLTACQERNIKVISLLDDREGLNTISASAEFTFMLILEALRLPVARELQGKKVGLIGLGRIGQRLLHYCEPFQVERVSFCDPAHNSWGGSTLTEIFRDSDIVVVCCALNDETEGMIGGPLIRGMKQNAILVNTARAEIIDEKGLLSGLRDRPDITYATDVLHDEVLGYSKDAKHRLEQLDNKVIITPHIAGNTFDSRTKAAKIILELLKKEPKLA